MADILTRFNNERGKYLKKLTPGLVKNILVVRQHNQIGDMICSLPMYAALKKKYPDAKIILVASKTNYPLPFFDINPYLDKVIVFDKSTIKNIFTFFKELRKAKYQLGIVPSTVKLSRTSHIINYLSGARVRIGIEKSDDENNSLKSFLHIRSPFGWNKNNVHQNERNLDVVRQIGCDLNNIEKDKIKLIPGNDDTDFALSVIKENFPDKERLIIGIHPGAGKEKNIWNTPNFISLIRKLYTKFNPYLVITSGWTDKEITDKLKTILHKEEMQMLVLKNLPVKKLVAIFEKIHLYITNDTGTMHIAGMTGVSLISLFGPTNPEEWAPSGSNKFFIKSKTEDINDISIDEVFTFCDSLLMKMTVKNNFGS